MAELLTAAFAKFSKIETVELESSDSEDDDVIILSCGKGAKISPHIEIDLTSDSEVIGPVAENIQIDTKVPPGVQTETGNHTAHQSSDENTIVPSGIDVSVIPNQITENNKNDQNKCPHTEKYQCEQTEKQPEIEEIDAERKESVIEIDLMTDSEDISPDAENIQINMKMAPVMQTKNGKHTGHQSINENITVLSRTDMPKVSNSTFATGAKNIQSSCPQIESNRRGQKRKHTEEQNSSVSAIECHQVLESPKTYGSISDTLFLLRNNGPLVSDITAARRYERSRCYPELNKPFVSLEEVLGDFKTPAEEKNLLNTPEYIPSRWTEDMRKFYFDSVPEKRNITCNEVLSKIPVSSNWNVSPEDLQRIYGGPSQSNSTRDQRKYRNLCHMCGEVGHNSTQCPQRMCLRCWAPSNRFRTSCFRCKRDDNVRCRRCNFLGHKMNMCPDLWRTCFEVGPRGEKIPIPDVRKDRRLIYCCNCGKQGHLFEECSKPKLSDYPCVSSYVTPYKAAAQPKRNDSPPKPTDSSSQSNNYPRLLSSNGTPYEERPQSKLNNYPPVSWNDTPYENFLDYKYRGIDLFAFGTLGLRYKKSSRHKKFKN